LAGARPPRLDCQANLAPLAPLRRGFTFWSRPTQRSSSPSAKSGSFQGGGGTARVCRLARSAEGEGSGAARAAQGLRRELLLSIYATDSSQKVDAGGEDRGDGSLYQGRSSGNVSATVRKPPTIAMASTKKTTTTSSPRVIGFPTGPMHFVRCATACLFTTEHRPPEKRKPRRGGAFLTGIANTGSKPCPRKIPAKIV
jgi:hypothetical protein